MNDEYVTEEFELRGYTVKIIHDQDAPNPRKEYENVGTMVCWHRNHILGDEQRTDEPERFFLELAEAFRPGIEEYLDNKLFDRMVKSRDYGSQEYKQQSKLFYERRRQVINNVLAKHYIMLPLGLYDHSGITMYIGSGSHPSGCDSGGWDSGQVGWIYATKQRAVKEWGKKACTKKVRDMALAHLRAEVEEYDKYLTGDVYGYVITDPDDNEVESCWGFFGLDYCIAEAKSCVPDEPALKGGEAEDDAHEEVLP